MITDWIQLARQINSLREDDTEIGGDSFAIQALDEILGNEWIETSVEYIVSFEHGGELAMNCLRHLRSTKATKYAYQVYKSSNGERANRAVWLIKHIANPISLDWVEEFLNDQNVILLGVDILDQLLLTEQIPYDEKVESLLDLADKNSNGQLKEHTDFIREYIDKNCR